MTNNQIAKQFQLLADLMEIHGNNAFKIRSYRNASRTIKRCEQNLADLSPSDVGRLKGIGTAISAKIEALLQTGSFPTLDRLLEKTPEGIVKLLKIKGLGPKKIKVLWQNLGIESAGELLYACEENRLLLLKGFGSKTQQNIRKSVEYYLAHAQHFRYADIIAEAAEIVKDFEAETDAEQVSLTGAIRRKMETVTHLEVVVACKNLEVLQEICERIKLTVAIDATNNQRLTGQTFAQTPIHVYYTEPSEFASQLFKTTASSAHWQNFSQIQPKIDVRISSEQAIYTNAKMDYIPPELREGRGEIALAQKKQLPQLIELTDITGVLHAHSTYSDGRHRLEDMAKACKQMGYQYLGISDHSRAAFYANGLSVLEINRQHQEIDSLNEQLAPFKIFKGIEADILNDGSLDYDEEIRARFDFVIASVHSNLKMTESQATKRLLRAIANPQTTILGHPTGRLLLSRPGYPINHKAIIDACAEYNVIIELNANPYRLDIDWRWLQYCVEKDVLVSINPDAHSIQGLEHIKYGIFVARKALISKHHVFNTLSLTKINAIFS